MISANEIFAQILSFFMLLFLLKHFAWKKILGLLDQRKEKISVEFKEIEDAKIQVAKIKADYESKVALIQEQAQVMINAAIEEGRKINDQIRKKAHEEAQDIITDARKQVKYEVAKVEAQLKGEIIDIALGAARNLIQERLTENGDRKIVEDFIKEIEKAQ